MIDACKSIGTFRYNMGHDLDALNRQWVIDWLDTRANLQLAEAKKADAHSIYSRAERIRKNIALVEAAKRELAKNGGLLEVPAPVGKALTVILDLEANQSPYDAENGILWGYFHPFAGMDSINVEKAFSRGTLPHSEAMVDYLAWKTEHFPAFNSKQVAALLEIENWRKSQEYQPELKIVLDPILKAEAERTLLAIGKLGFLYEWIVSVNLPERKTCVVYGGMVLECIELTESKHGYHWLVTEYDHRHIISNVKYLPVKGFCDDLAAGNGIVALLGQKLHFKRPFWQRGAGYIKRSGFYHSEPPSKICSLAQELDAWGFSVEIIKDENRPLGCRIQFHDFGLDKMWLECDEEWTSVQYFDSNGQEDLEYWPANLEKIPQKSLTNLALRAGGNFSRLEMTETRFTAMIDNAYQILAAT
jgi:hypothetical protein